MNKVRFLDLMEYCCVRSQVVEFECQSDGDEGEGERFTATAYCLLDGNSYDEQCLLFIDKFSIFTLTNWIALKKINTCVRYAFRKTYTCQLARRNKKTCGGEHVNTTRDKECLARVDIKWKHVNRSTIRNDPHLSNGLNCIVKINFDHSHSLTAMDTLACLRSTKETNALFNAYFQLGLTPADAKSYHEMSLIDGVINEDLVPHKLANAQINPSMRHVMHMHNVWKTDHKPDEPFTFDKLTKLAETLAKYGSHLAIDKETLTTAIITPLMTRVFNEFSQRQEKLTVWIENTDYFVSSRYCGKRALLLTLFFVSTKIGALPIGCALHNSDNTQIAYKLLKEALEKCSGKTFSPDVIIAGDDIVQRIAQQLVFPGTTNLLNISKVCQGIWKWLCPAKRGCDREVRKTIMQNVQKVIVSQTVEAATEAFRSMCTSLKDHPQAVKHLEFIWFRRSEWCLCFRNPHPDSAVDFQDCETSIRILTNTLLLRCKSFNPCTLINVICHFLEKYNKERLERASREGASTPPHYSKYMKPISPGDVTKVSDDEHQFIFKSGELPCTACTDIAFCDCPVGCTGRFCEHLCSLVKQLTFWTKTPEITPDDRSVFSRLTSGLANNGDPLLIREEILDFEFVKAEPMEENDDMTLMTTNEDIPTEEDIKQDFKPEEIDIKDVHVVSIPYLFEELDDADPPAKRQCAVTIQVVKEAKAPGIDQGSHAADVSRPSRPPGDGSTSGNLHGRVTLMNGVTIANIRERFDKIADLMSTGEMTSRQLTEFNKVLDDITTPDRAKVFCEEVTKFKKLKRLGFRLPTMAEERQRAQTKFSKWRASNQKNGV